MSQKVAGREIDGVDAQIQAGIVGNAIQPPPLLQSKPTSAGLLIGQPAFIALAHLVGVGLQRGVAPRPQSQSFLPEKSLPFNPRHHNPLHKEALPHEEDDDYRQHRQDASRHEQMLQRFATHFRRVVKEAQANRNGKLFR